MTCAVAATTSTAGRPLRPVGELADLLVTTDVAELGQTRSMTSLCNTQIVGHIVVLVADTPHLCTNTQSK